MFVKSFNLDMEKAFELLLLIYIPAILLPRRTKGNFALGLNIRIFATICKSFDCLYYN